MNLDDFFNDPYFGEFTGSASSTQSSTPQYTSTSTYEGMFAGYETPKFSLETYVPKTIVNIDRIIKELREHEQAYVSIENYESAADIRDKITRIDGNREMLVKLYDLKEQALASRDYGLVYKIKQKIDNIINGDTDINTGATGDI